MNSEELEFAISQYLDGNLPPGQAPALEELLRTDPAAQGILNQYKKLNDAVRASSPTLPQVKWDRLAMHLSQTIADHSKPVVYRISFYRPAVRFALAASVLLAIGFFWPRTPASQTPEVSAPSELVVLGPQPEPATGPMELDVTVGQPPAPEVASAYTTDSLVVQRSAVALDGFTQPGGEFH
jgi:anti-sigma factor RsiW